MHGKWQLAAVLLVCVGAVVPVAADGAASSATFHGHATSTIEGDNALDCAARILHAAVEKGPLIVEAHAASWRAVVVETRDVQSAAVGVPRLPYATGEEELRSLPQQLRLVSYGEDPLVQVLPAALVEDEDATMDVTSDAGLVRWSTAATAQIGVPHWRPDDGATAAAPADEGGRYALWNGFGEAATLELETQHELQVQGDLVLLLRNVSVLDRSDAPPMAQTGPAIEHQEDLQVPGAESRRVLWREAWLHLEGATLRAPAVESVRCASIHALVEGRYVRDPFQGTIEARGETWPVEDRSVGLRGNITIFEQLAADGATAPVGAATGTFSVYGVAALAPAAAPETRVVELALGAALVFGVLAAATKALPSLLWAIHYSRLDESKLLEHPSRSLLHDHIAANPGHDVQTIARRTGISRSVVRHHIEVLERGGVVVRHRVQGRVLITIADADDAIAVRALCDREPAFGLIHGAVADGPVPRSRVVRRLAEALPVSDRSARRWVQRALDARIVRADDRPSDPWLTLDPSVAST